MKMSRYDQLIGQILDGRYRVDALLGIGGMAVVLLGYDLRDKRKIAIKMLREELAKDEQAVKRFVSECKTASMMDHPGLVKIYDVVIDEDDKYMVMQYIEGETLRTYIDRVGTISPDRVIAITKQILKALTFVHAKGVVHRDVKPQNILILKNGDVVLTDFGIAKNSENEETEKKSDDSKTVGTIYYVSPEQAENEKVDARSDLYSLGVTVFEMLTGVLPFNGESTLEIVKMHLNVEPPHIRDILPTVPKGLEQFVLYAMEKSPADRFQSAEQMLRYLEVLEADPFAVFAIAPRDQYRIYLEEEEKKNALSEKAEEDEEEKEVVRYLKGDSWSPIPILSGICVALAIVLAVSGYYALVNIFWDSDLNVFKDRSGEDVIIENYIGEAFTEADRAHLLDDIGYQKVTIIEEHSEIHEKGVVFAQEPKGGEVRKLKTVELTVYISLGSNTVDATMPDYSMQDYRIVHQKLVDAGYKVVLQEVISSAVDSCLIIETVPPAGSKTTEGMTVTLRYSAGPDADKVIYYFPEFVGKTEREAAEYISSYGLNLVSVEYVYSNDVSEGTVISCSVSKGPKPILTPIKLVISLGIDPNNILPPSEPTIDPISE